MVEQSVSARAAAEVQRRQANSGPHILQPQAQGESCESQCPSDLRWSDPGRCRASLFCRLHAQTQQQSSRSCRLHPKCDGLRLLCLFGRICYTQVMTGASCVCLYTRCTLKLWHSTAALSVNLPSLMHKNRAKGTKKVSPPYQRSRGVTQ